MVLGNEKAQVGNIIYVIAFFMAKNKTISNGTRGLVFHHVLLCNCHAWKLKKSNRDVFY